jgi:hypothetical protein
MVAGIGFQNRYNDNVDEGIPFPIRQLLSSIIISNPKEEMRVITIWKSRKVMTMRRMPKMEKMKWKP